MNPAHRFCTLFNCNYLLKGVVMLESLLSHCPESSVQVLCMDDATHGILSRLDLPRVSLLRLPEVENDELRRVKPGRSIAEYCWTLGPALCWHVLASDPEAWAVTYLDADLMFFSDVQPLFDEIGDASITIIEHRFAPKFTYMEAWGRFNVEWVGFRRTPAGLRCLKTWRDQCIDWCFARVEENRLGDQKYLDAWPETYGDDLHILRHVGAGIAPWNFSKHTFLERDGQIYVDGVPLVFYHFNQFQLLKGGRFDYMTTAYSEDAVVPASVYGRYERALLDALGRVRRLQPDFHAGIRPAGAVLARRAAQRYLPITVKNLMRRLRFQPW